MLLVCRLGDLFIPSETIISSLQWLDWGTFRQSDCSASLWDCLRYSAGTRQEEILAMKVALAVEIPRIVIWFGEHHALHVS
jgi:hypothetical protein